MGMLQAEHPKGTDRLNSFCLNGMIVGPFSKYVLKDINCDGVDWIQEILLSVHDGHVPVRCNCMTMHQMHSPIRKA